MKDTALITGASSGIGLELARIHASKGTDLILVSRDKNKLKKIADNLSKKHGIEVGYIGLDLSSPGSAEKVKKYLEDNNIRLKYIINNAGFGSYNKFSEQDPDEIQEMINLNILTLTKLTRLLLPLIDEDGHIVNISSTAAFSPIPKMAVYAATKSYVLNFSLALSEELRDKEIYVLAYCPGPTRTGFSRRAKAEDSSFFKGNLPSSEEVAQDIFNATEKKKKLVIYGARYKVLISLQKFLPRSLQARIVKMMDK